MRTRPDSSWLVNTVDPGGRLRCATAFLRGAASAEKNLTSLHAGYLTPGDPQAFLAKAPNDPRRWQAILFAAEVARSRGFMVYESDIATLRPSLRRRAHS